jgi:hypothetical protein
MSNVKYLGFILGEKDRKELEDAVDYTKRQYKTTYKKSPGNIYASSSTSFKIKQIMGVIGEDLTIYSMPVVSDDAFRDGMVFVG